MFVWLSVLLAFQAFSFLESKKEEVHIIQKPTQNLPTFNSLWESNNHYIEAKNNVLFGKLNELKENSSVDALQEFDGYVFFQFVHNLASSSVIVADQLKSHISLGVSTDVCHLDEEGVVSYKLSLVVDEKNQKLKWNGNAHLILLKMYSDSQCSVEFGQYLLDNVEADLRRNDSQLLITTSADQKLPIPVKGSLFKVVPKDKENGLPSYIFAIENNAPLFNNIINNTNTAGVDELVLHLECSVVGSETKLVTFTAMKNNQPTTIYSRKLPFLNDFIYSTSPNRQTLTTSDLFATVMQLIDVSLEKVAKEPPEAATGKRNLRGVVSDGIVPSILENRGDDDIDDDRIDSTSGSANAENKVGEQLWVVTFECI